MKFIITLMSFLILSISQAAEVAHTDCPAINNNSVKIVKSAGTVTVKSGSIAQ